MFVEDFRQAGESRAVCGYQGHMAWLFMPWAAL